MMRGAAMGRVLWATLTTLASMTGCLPQEEDGATVIGSGDAGSGSGGNAGNGGGQPPTGGGVVGPGGSGGGDVTPVGGNGSGGDVSPTGGNNTGGNNTGGNNTGGNNTGGSNPGGEVTPTGGDNTGGSGAGGTPACEPDCRGKTCGPDGCGGNCGPGCAIGEVCAEGQCSSAGCPGDLIDCSGECSTLLDDVNHCGNCRTACPTDAGAGAVPVCLEAECYLTCRGHEREPRSIDFENDPANCGRCGNTCEGARNGQPQCGGGRCLDPCQGGYEACQGRCFPAESFAENCDGACCPVVRPGQIRGEAMNSGETRAYTIEVDGPHRIRASLTFDDGSCPGFDSPFDNANESILLSINTGDELGNRTMLSRGREGPGTGTACIVTDAQALGGAYEVILQPREGLPSYTLNVEVLAPAARRAAGDRADRTGIYPEAIPENRRAEIPMRLAAPQHLVFLGTADEVNNGYPEACLHGDIAVLDGQGNLVADDDTFCPVLDEVLAPGDYTLTGVRTFDDADPSFRAVVFLEAIGGPAARPLPEGGQIQGGGLDRFEMERYTFSLASETAVSFQFVGDGCEAAAFRVAESAWFRSSDDDPCGAASQRLPAGDYTLWVHGRGWNALGNFTLETSVGGGGAVGGEVIDRSGNYPRPAILANGQDAMTLRLAAARTVTLMTSDGQGGCPADTTLMVMRNGRQVVFDDDGNGRCSRVSQDFDAGDYDVVVAGFNGGAVPAYVLEAILQ